MKTRADKSEESKTRTLAKRSSGRAGEGKFAAPRAGSRPEAVARGRLRDMAAGSVQTRQLRAIRELADRSPQVNRLVRSQAMADNRSVDPVQRQGMEEEPLQGRFETIQKQADLEDEELLQGRFETLQRLTEEEEEPLQGRFAPVQREETEEEEPLQGKFAPRRKTENDTGMPDRLKSGIEQLSRVDMSDVKVHYDSARPARLQAHAYAQGTDIHLAPGQEKHLPHEAWHLVQQKQGRVKPTMQLRGSVDVNDDAGLEREADVMGARAVRGGR